MPHQEEGVRFLLERKAGILAFEQGLGKTLTAIEAFGHLLGDGQAGHMLIVCPNSLKRNWQSELSVFAPRWSVDVIEGSAKVRRKSLASTAAEVIILNYETARAEITPIRALMQRLSPVLVFDESHHVKNRRSLTGIAAKHFAPLASYRWLLTGTPVTNSPEDIYTQVQLVANGEPLGPYEVFMLDYGDSNTNQTKQSALSERVRPFLLRRTKEESLSLPGKIFVDIFVQLPLWQRVAYDEVRDGIISKVNRMSRSEFNKYASTALSRLLRLSQLASNPSLVFPDEARESGKQIELDRIIGDLVEGSGHKVILWSYYVKTIAKLVERYRGLGVAAIYGETPLEERQSIVKQFQEDSSVRLFVGNPAAAGTGFTLTAAAYTVYETLNWRYDLYAQSQDRNHRIGQTATVTYLRLIAEDTIDQVIVEALNRKGSMARTIVGDRNIAFSTTEMSPHNFCKMLISNRLPL